MGRHIWGRGVSTLQMQTLTDSPCNLCSRECGVNRKQGEKGYCFSLDHPVVARAALHMWEEPCISGEMGSGAVFFAGCSLRCVYCQNFELARGRKGREVSTEQLSDIFLSLQGQGAANINLVTPDHFTLAVIPAVRMAREKGLTLPVIYNCSGYEKEELIESLRGTVDIFLVDFKYMEEELAQKYSSAPDYPEVAEKALARMLSLTGDPVFDERGMMQKGIIVRHLLLPGHKKNARKVIDYIHQNYGDRVILSLMNQYTPFERLKERDDCRELCRKVTKREYETVIEYALSLGMENVFIQEGETAKESFIPEFDGEGILEWQKEDGKWQEESGLQ